MGWSEGGGADVRCRYCRPYSGWVMWSYKTLGDTCRAHRRLGRAVLKHIKNADGDRDSGFDLLVTNSSLIQATRRLRHRIGSRWAAYPPLAMAVYLIKVPKGVKGVIRDPAFHEGGLIIGIG